MAPVIDEAPAAGSGGERRARLLEAKLGALVASRDVDHAEGRPASVRVAKPFAGGAGLVDGDRAWVLVDGPARRSLGPALAWSRSAGVSRVELVVEGDAGLVARRALFFAVPPRVWRVEGRSLVPAEPEPLPDEVVVDPRVLALEPELLAAGCDTVVEHGRLVGEVDGLEVARVTLDEAGQPRLEVGVGRFDREAQAEISGGDPSLETLRSVVERVREARAPDAPVTPLRRLAPERGLRSRLVREPALVGATSLRALPAVVEAPDLRTPTPAAAVGTDLDGRPVIVVASSGVDLDLVPTAADQRAAAGAGDDVRLILALPPRDALPVTHALAALLVHPAEVVPVP